MIDALSITPMYELMSPIAAADDYADAIFFHFVMYHFLRPNINCRRWCGRADDGPIDVAKDDVMITSCIDDEDDDVPM